jgi:hypothetical protein
MSKNLADVVSFILSDAGYFDDYTPLTRCGAFASLTVNFPIYLAPGQPGAGLLT